ncbi:MAG: EpsG family protein [Defluviitaleaceae bacterium]|nr:EpsG family protein [Defluviitaleaceae bacterium]
MLAYYAMLAGLVLCGSLLCIYKRSRLKDGIFLIISFVVLGVMSAIRYDVGYDYSYIYAPGYYEILNDPTGASLQFTRWEPGFQILLRVMMIFSQNFQTIFAVTSFLTIFLIMLFFWLYSPNPLISVFLFITLSHFYCSMNFIRQTLAVAIAVFAFPLLKKIVEEGRELGAPKILLCSAGYFAIVSAAATIHMSALLLIPFFFINLIPITKNVLAVYAVATAVIYFNTHHVLRFVTQFWYQQYALDSVHLRTYFSPQFTLAAGAAFFILLLGHEALERAGKGNRLYVNYAFFAFLFVLMGTRHSVLDRFSLNFVLVVPVGIAILVVALAEELKEARFTEAAKKYVATFAVLIFTIVVGGLSIHHYALSADHHGVVPYQIIFNQPFYREYVARLRGRGDYIVITAEPEPEPAPEPIIVPENIDLPAMPFFEPEPPGVLSANPVPGRPLRVGLDRFLEMRNMNPEE